MREQENVSTRLLWPHQEPRDQVLGDVTALSIRYARAEFTKHWPSTEAACTAALSGGSSRSMRS
jgi:hypothetical protein